MLYTNRRVRGNALKILINYIEIKTKCRKS